MGLDRFFGLSEAGTDVKTEVVGGLTTYLTMSYILFVQPAFLSAAGMDGGAVLTATCIASGVACLIMGLWARYPVALAPGMGLNAFFAFTVCGAMGIPWQQALGLVVMSGVLFLLLGLAGLRERLVAIVPEGLRHGIAAGIGLFIAFIGLKEGGWIVVDPNTFVGTTGLADRWQVVVTSGSGFAVAAVATVRRWPAPVLLGIATSVVVGASTGIAQWHGVVSAPPSLAPTAFAVDFAGLMTPTHIGLILLFLYTDLFDTVGTLMGVATQAEMIGPDGKLPRGGRAFFADAVGTTVGGFLGTSTVTSYIESTAGVAAGARTGLAATTVGLLFFASLFFYPLAQTVGGATPIQVDMMTAAGPASHTLFVHPMTAPALLLIGAMMARSLGHIQWKVPRHGIPAFLTVVGIPLTFSIADGISLGILAASGLSLFDREGEPASPWLHVVAAALALRWITELVG